ncbi:MAG: hypothetical protein DLM62_20405 [Pseudonocardiales bacterium]|nr:MAG: hypothetical protein DLM62_20405 [Pseudonocardiales bacterium]
MIREMPRTGTGPFPAQRSAFPVPGGQYGILVRDTQFSAAPYGGSYRPAASSGQYAVAIPGGYYGPVAAAHEDPARPGQWPLQSRLELGALPGAVPCARLHARLVLTEWGQAALADSVELIVSELMTNALRACSDPVAGGPGYDADGRQQPLGLRLASDRQQVLVEVWDGATAPPVPGQVSHDGETGRGLLMVKRPAAAGGTTTQPASRGAPRRTRGPPRSSGP